MSKKKDKPKKDKLPPIRAAKPETATASGGSPTEQAQRLLREASRNPDRRERADLAARALALNPDAVEAHVILAEQARSRKEAVRRYREAVAVGERNPGADPAPYWKARLGLAHALWTSGKRDDGILHVRELLRLQPDDDLAVRFTLAAWLLNADRDSEVAQLIEQYADEKLATWTYCRTLLAFRKEGDTEESRKRLKQARKSNKHVPGYLLGDKDPTEAEGDTWEPGDPSEAMEYAQGFLAAWRSTEGALDWLRSQTGSARKKPRTEKPAVEGPSPSAKKALLRLPRQEDVWQVDCRQLPLWLIEDGKPVRPWVVLVFDPESGQVIGNDTTVSQPSAASLWDLLAGIMARPHMNPPHRPLAIHYPATQPWSELQPHWQEVEVGFEVQPALSGIDEVFPALVEQMAGKPTPGLLDAPGVTPDLARRFYDAAAQYYRQAPWKQVGYESAIEVRCDKFESGPWYAMVMGQSGLTLGLALYHSLRLLRRLWADELTDEDNARQTVGTSVTFGDITSLPIADLEACQEHGWPIGRSDAYPTVFHKERGMSMRPPLAWELELLEACLRAIPDFIRRRPQEDTTPEEMTVPAGTSQLTLRLAWVGEEETAEEKPAKRQRRKPPPAETDDLFDILLSYWSTIREAYEDHAEHRPIILVDIQEEQVYAFPYEEFKDQLSPAGRQSLEAQYQQAGTDNQVVVFARDNEKRRLVSYSLDLETDA